MAIQLDVSALLSTALSHSELGRHAEALDLRQQALAVYRRVLPADHPDIAKAMKDIANSKSELGRHVEALDLFEQALAVYQRVLPADHPDIASITMDIANSQSELGRYVQLSVSSSRRLHYSSACFLLTTLTLQRP